MLMNSDADQKLLYTLCQEHRHHLLVRIGNTRGELHHYSNPRPLVSRCRFTMYRGEMRGSPEF